MISRVRASVTLVFAAAMPLVATGLPASAADLPLVKLSQSNKVPACATPGRLIGFLKGRNPHIDQRFEEIAADYMRIGDELQVRWDIAFFQMLIETGNLNFRGNVKADQNNFVGIGAIGKGLPGESFADVASGVKAHLQHLLVYTGEHVDSPVAERTRNVQEWGVLASWQKTISGPMSYSQLFKQWAPSRPYGREISNLTESFYGATCRAADPNPEMMALAKPGKVKSKTAGRSTAKALAAVDSDATSVQQVASAGVTGDEASDEVKLPQFTGIQLAQRAIESERETSYRRSSLGASSLVSQDEPSNKVAVGEPASPDSSAATQVKIINSNAAEETESGPTDVQPATRSSSSDPIKPTTSSKKTKVAALGAGTKDAILPNLTAKSSSGSGSKSMCKVWTASYGGGHSVIIKASADSQDNYTVLDVNEGSEQREAEAYIAAYARGGRTLGQFTNPTQALDKAFELCPEG